MSSSTQSDEWITIPVPKRVAPAVYALIAQEMGVGVSATDITSDSAPGNTTWTDAEVDRAIDESPPGMKAIFEKLAQHAGQWVHANQLAEALQTRLEHFGGENKPEANWNNVAGTLGAFGHRVKSRYGKERWFTDTKEDAEGWYVHRMSREHAERVLARLKGGGS